VSHNISNGIKGVEGGVSAAIQCVAQHEEQVVEARCTVLAQAAQAAKHLTKHALAHTLRQSVTVM